MIFKIFTIEPQYIPGLKDWGKRLMTDFNEEALISLKEENVMMESMNLIETNEGAFIIAFQLSEYTRPSNKSREVNILHREATKHLIQTETFPVSGRWEMLYYLSV